MGGARDDFKVARDDFPTLQLRVVVMRGDHSVSISPLRKELNCSR